MRVLWVVALLLVGCSRENVQRFDIGLRYLSPVTKEQKAVFERAARKWEQAIVADLPGAQLRLSNSNCAGRAAAFLGRVDDLLIDVKIGDIPEANVLGEAGPCVIRALSKLPVYGVMNFDAEAIQALIEEGTFEDVIRHEMGHVLGFGILWNQRGLVNTVDSNFCVDDPRFAGTGGLREWQRLGGTGEVPVENGFGSSTCNSHWRESAFANEMMTGIIDAERNPMSRLTIAAMADMGYTVNLEAAEPYSLAPEAAHSQATVTPRNERMIVPEFEVEEGSEP
jgi:hypothetical protein